MSKFNLKLSFRKGPGDQIYVKILEQEIEYGVIPFKSKDGYCINIALSPEINNNTFYLQGEHDKYDFTSIFAHPERLSNVLKSLRELSVNNNLFTKIELTKDNITVQISDNIEERYDDPSNIITNINSLDLSIITNSRETCIGCNSGSNIGEHGYCMECKKSIVLCKICSNSSVDLIKHVTSTGKKINLCKGCNRVRTCDSCNYSELRIHCDSEIFINDNGDNGFLTICKQCSNQLIKCRYCGSHYNKVSNICPCKLPTNFKKYIYGHFEDVTHHLPLDIFSNELFGIEIEVGTLVKNRIKYEEIYLHTNELISMDAILKYDASIDYLDGSAKEHPNKFRGMEIVTRPMTFKNASRFLRNLADNRHEALRSWEVGTAGIHIHVSKNSLTKLEISKLLSFISEKKNRAFITMIAKREDKKYAKFVPRKISQHSDVSPDCHYHALNTNKPHTIEFRIFRGTLNADTMLSYLQFVKSLIEFVKSSPFGYVNAKKSELNIFNYCNWLNKTEKSRFRQLKYRINSEDLGNIMERGEV